MSLGGILAKGTTRPWGRWGLPGSPIVPLEDPTVFSQFFSTLINIDVFCIPPPLQTAKAAKQLSVDKLVKFIERRAKFTGSSDRARRKS